MKDIENQLKTTFTAYNSGVPHLSASISLVASCLSKLSSQCTYELFGPFRGKLNITNYKSFSLNNEYARPIREDLFIIDTATYLTTVNETIEALRSGQLSHEDEKKITQVIYTSVMAFASCIDLWKRGSRKTPGTFFEVFVAALMQAFLSGARFTKHVPLNALASMENDQETLEKNDELEDDQSSLSTDLVISTPKGDRNAVIPLKITTRERIVQPFAHQRILDSAFGPGVYDSFLACISETQMDHKSRTVKQVCVPGTVKLFKKHLGDIRAIYYCDIPERYNEKDLQDLIPVKHIGSLFNDVKDYLNSNTQC